MMMETIVLERLTRVAPFGVRFWDPVLNHAITDGLSVTAYPFDNSARRSALTPNRSGVHVLHHAPGLEAFTFGAGDEPFWENLPPVRRFVIEVTDTQRRFHPAAFIAALPIRGLFGWDDPSTSPRSTFQPLVPLYSALSRSVPQGMAVMRTELWDARNDGPAAWAVVETQIERQGPLRAVADERGRVAAIFPYPEPVLGSVASPLRSPPGDGSRPLTEQTWPVQFRVFYSPRIPASRFLPLDDVLSQAPATVLASLSPPLPLPELRLAFGKELIVKSQLRSELLVIPAGSPV
jgi:hypothetical protein